jgi:hypothetical protein
VTGSDPPGRTLPVAIAAAVLLAALTLVMPRGFLVMDEAGRYLQTVSLAGGLRFPPPVPYPGAGLLGDAAGDCRPLPYHYGIWRDGTLYSQYGPLLALLCLPGYLLAGRTGAFLFPAAGALALWLVMRRILRDRGFGNAASSLLPLLGTPLLFYSQTYWSYTAVMTICVAAWAWQRRIGTTWALAMVFAAALLRVEVLVTAPFILLRDGSTPLVRRLAAAAVIAALFLASQKLLTGQWLGTHVSASGAEQSLYGHQAMDFLQRKAFVFGRSLFGLVPGAPAAFGLASGALLWLLWGLSWTGGPAGRLSLFAGLLLSAAAVASSVFRGLPLFDLFSLKHPLVFFPVLWLVRPADWRIPLGMVLILLLAAGPMHVEDLAWGTRLLIVPFTLAAAGALPERGRVLPVAVTGLVCVLVSMLLLWSRRQRSEDLAELAATNGGAVITTSWLLPGEFAGLQAEGVPVVMTDRSGEYLEALDRLSGLDPVVVCLERDLGTTLEITGNRVPEPSIEGVIGFDPAMRVAVISF